MNMKLRLCQLRDLLYEGAYSAASLPANIKLYEDGDEHSRYFFLVDADDMPNIEDAVIGGISISDYGGPWGVGSVASHQGYGPLLYRLAMEWVGQNAGGRGLTKNRGGETSNAALRVWSKFDSERKDLNVNSGEFTATSKELRTLRKNPIQLTPGQVSTVKNMLWSLEIGGQERYNES